MSRLGKITRRTFIISSAVVAGGAAFGVYQAMSTPKNPLSPSDGSVSLNPWVIIDQNGVTLITPRAEMGQGVYTTLAALVAEELDVAWDDVRVLHGPPAKAYFNAIVMEAASTKPFYERTDLSAWKKTMMTALPKMLSSQVTGGSSTTTDAYERLRIAGAVAREAIKQAAADRWNLPVDDLHTVDGQVIAPDGTMLTYSALALDAANIKPRTDLALRPKSEWKYLGKSMPRVDMVEKSTGTAEFGADVILPDMKFATVRMNPKLGSGMLGFDASAALKMDGVEKIIDLGHGIGVVASNTWLAFQAAEAVEIEWISEDFPITTVSVFEELEASFDAKPNTVLRDDGDVETASGTVIEAEYRVPYLAHSTMEPMNATALLEDDKLTVWCGNQAPILARAKAAKAAGVKSDDTTVHTTYLGGGFGRRVETDFAVYAAQIAKEMSGTPVKVMWSREEDMRHDYYRPAAIARCKGSVENGQATSMLAQVAAPSILRQAVRRLSGFTPPGPDSAHMEGMFNQPYGIPNYRTEGYLADLDIPIGPWRSVSNSFNGFFHESFIDELAHAADADPLAFRLNLIRKEHEPSAKLLEEVAEMSGWFDPKPKGVGRGVAFCYSFGTPVAEVIEIKDEDGAIRINKAWIACDVGTALDPSIIKAQMMSGLMYGLSAAVLGEITFDKGEVEQFNFPDYDALRMNTAPSVDVRVLENNAMMGGVGEPGTPPSMPALANAVFDLTGIRPRELPLSKTFDFVF